MHLPLIGMLVALSAAAPGRAEPKPAVGATRVARWQDDRTAAFLLMFDDSCPSHWQVAVPELAKRDLIATFYLNPGKAEFEKFRDHWEKDLWKRGMVYGNHTMTHRGVKDFADADREIGECARVIRAMVPDKDPKKPRLLSYAQPGVAPGAWNITDAQLKALFDKHRLVGRADAKGHMAVYHLKTAAEMLALADRAVERKGLEYLILHGVERKTPDWGYQDFWALKQDAFLPLLDGLKERRDKEELWVIDHITSHKYETERDGAAVRILEAGDRQIRLELTSAADPESYDVPLTLVTRVPERWDRAKVTQGDRVVTVKVVAGTARYRAMPNGGPVSLTVP